MMAGIVFNFVSMSVKSILAKPFANVIHRRITKWSKEAERAQEFWCNRGIVVGTEVH